MPLHVALMEQDRGLVRGKLTGQGNARELLSS